MRETKASVQSRQGFYPVSSSFSRNRIPRNGVAKVLHIKQAFRPLARPSKKRTSDHFRICLTEMCKHHVIYLPTLIWRKKDTGTTHVMSIRFSRCRNTSNTVLFNKQLLPKDYLSCRNTRTFALYISHLQFFYSGFE